MSVTVGTMKSGARSITQESIANIISLATLLGEFGQIKRVTLLPNGEQESDSHHSFSLALLAYEFAKTYAPELDTHKILLYALVHDLPELITGDTDTLTASEEELRKKARQDTEALAALEEKLENAPHIWQAVQEYEAKTTQEALFVYWVDKMITIPTHFLDNGENLRKLGVHKQSDIQQWYARTLNKLSKQALAPHPSAVQLLEMAYMKLHDDLLEA